ncbi:hypothetical protein [Kitasatospora sp. NPDC059571]|uniref:hypothetical protein n=1 Tax=Kitasatospora sp. NPDC059571 TaxID=3346871 RepID=UPI0036CADC99
MNDGSTAPEFGGQPQQPEGSPSTGEGAAAPGPAVPGQPAAYGYPPAQEAGPFGYGYPQGATAYGYPPPAEPDWQELADRNAQSTRRRRRALLIGGGVLAVAAVAGLVATALVLSRGRGAPEAAEASPSPSVSASGASASASPSAPTTPLQLLGDSRLDKAALSAEALFPAKTLTVQDRRYTLLGTDSDKDCNRAPVDGLEKTLASADCRTVYRATYADEHHVQVTVGVAVFTSSSRAKKAKADGKGRMGPLVKGGAKGFCATGVTCATSRSSLGRYAYFTVAGPDDGSAVPADDKAAQQAGRDVASSVYDTLLERGRTGLASYR